MHVADQFLEAHAKEKDEAIEHQVVRVLAQVLERFDAQSSGACQLLDGTARVGAVSRRKRVFLGAAFVFYRRKDL